MAGVVQLLLELGFGENEARAYLTLLQLGPASGYELAKASGIPRPNIYKTAFPLAAAGQGEDPLPAAQPETGQ